jgi:hypothetical protein
LATGANKNTKDDFETKLHSVLIVSGIANCYQESPYAFFITICWLSSCSTQLLSLLAKKEIEQKTNDDENKDKSHCSNILKRNPQAVCKWALNV